MINYDEKMVLNSRLVIKMGIDQIGKNFVKSMSVKKFSYLGQFILGLRRSAYDQTIYFLGRPLFLSEDVNKS